MIGNYRCNVTSRRGWSNIIE